MDRELLLDLTNKFFARRASGDIDGMLELAGPEIVCFPDSTWRHARYPRRIVGKEALREALRQRHINYVPLGSTIHRTLIDGDQVVVHLTTTLRERGGGVTYTFDSIDFLRFSNGLIVEFTAFPDGSAHDAVVHFPH